MIPYSCMPANFDIDGWIIAGGASSRLGVDKAGLKLGGVTLIELAARALSPVSNRISIAGKPRRFAPQYMAFPDREAAGGGPMSGLATALSNGDSEWIAVISCDLPFVTGEIFLKLAFAIRHRADAVVPLQLDERPQPLCALYRRTTTLVAVGELLNGPDRSLRNLFSRIATHYVSFDAFSDLPNAQHLFLNINFPADYARAEEILSRKRA